MTKHLHATFLSAFILLTCSISFAQTSNAPYTIPLVVHIVHNNGPENIPDSVVTQTLSRINDNFNARNAALSTVATPFANIVANMQIEFCLAHTDPSGNVTTGIDRIVSLLTYYGDTPTVKLNQWPSTEYFNIWIVDSLDTHKYGYALLPQDAALHPGLDGAVMPYSLLTAGGTGDGLLTNVMAHYLNLENIWGNTNQPGVACGDDDVYDTPITKGTWMNACLTSQSICDPPTIENVQNFMDVAPCACMFTNGQKQRVYAALDTTVAGRNNLWTASNLAVTCAAPNGIKTVSANSVMISPNPFMSQVLITGLENGDQSFSIYDVTGRMVWSKSNVTVSQKSISLDLSAIATAGVYTLAITRGDTRSTFKLVREK
jgi:hypothetical protein